MPNEIKNALKASTSHVTTNHTMSRQLPVAGSSTVSVMVWTISGIVLASCGGGGGGGAGGSGLSVSGSGSNGDGGGGGSSASGPSGNIARVVDGPVKGAAVYFDIDGDGEVSDSERAAQKQNGGPMYMTDANGYVNAPIAFEGHFFIANVDNATDTATGDTLSGEYQSLSTGGIATPITDLITDQIGASGSDADAQGVLDDIFGTDGLVTVADIRDAEKYKIQEYDVPKPTLPSDPTDAQRAQYDRYLAEYKTSVIMKSSLALSEIDKDGAFTNLESPTARVDALKQIFDDDPNNGDSALMVRIDTRVDAGREILGISKPLAQPDSSVSPINEDSVFRFPQGSEDIFGFTDPNGNSDDAAASRFTGIYVKSSVDFPQADDDAHTVNLLYDGSPLSRHEGAGSDSLPGNLPPEAGFYYVSSENLSRLSISPSPDDSGTLELEYYVFDGEQWSDKASLEITVSPVDDLPTAVSVIAQGRVTDIDENTDLTGGMKVADLDVTDTDGAPHKLSVGGAHAGFFAIRNEDELWLVEGTTLDFETTPTLTVQVEVSGAPAINTGAITVTVNNVNEAPTATPRAGISTNDHRAYTLEAVDFGFSDVDANDNEFHSVIITSLPGQGQGTLDLNGTSVRAGDAITFTDINNGRLIYMPMEQQEGGQPYNAEIGYRVLDDGDGDGINSLSSDVATLAIRVGPNQSATAVSVIAQGRVAAIDENTDLTGGMKVADLDVIDADGAPHRLTLSGANAGLFAIRNEDELWLVEGTTLDFETTPTLTVQVEVSGAPAINTGAITVRVNNVNDNAPVITHSGRQVPLDEGTFSSDTNTGYRYTVSDADTPRALLIPIVSGDLQNRFAIDASGNLQIKAGSEFNYESLDEGAITLTITATDSGVGPGSPAVTDTETVIITFGDVNEAPTATPRVGISTNDHRAYTLEAVDFGFSDVDANDNEFHSVIITSLPGQGQGTLEFNGTSVRAGDAITFTDINNGRLIYMPMEQQEGGQPYNAAIGYRVVDDGDAGGANKLSSDAATLMIAVGANQPATAVSVMGQGRVTDIDENTDLTSGMKVADLDVTDTDGAPHRLVLSGANAGLFAIRNDDELWLVEGTTLDFETTPTLTVQVGIAGVPDITPVNITVTVNNVNDNAPVITHSGRQTPLLEGTFSVDTNTRYRYTASDADGGTSRLTLSGDPRERFQIDTNGNLQIKANSEFDYENPDDSSITLTITAADSGVGSGNQPINTTETVTIRLRNINDNPPVITQSGRQVPLDEGTFSSDTNTGYSYTVSDADTPRALLIPRVSGDLQNRFAIDASGNLQIKAGSEFNYESLDEGAITLTITATDSGVGPGSPAVTDTETVIITFGDVNEAPTATPRAGISTNDNLPYAFQAADFGFSDVDAGDDQFYSVIITSLPGQGQGTLELNGTSVSINTPITLADINNGRLIYIPMEQQGQTYNAEIGYRVVDDGDGAGGNGLRSDAATLVIEVGANQSATAVSVIAQGRVAAIDENTDLTSGMKVADLDVTDADDAPHRLTLSGANAGLFAIRNEDELWLVEGTTLDFEATPTLTVQVEVSGAPAINTGAITVTVNNVNEAPVATPRTDISTNDHRAYTLEAVDFGFSDVDADDSQFYSVIITSLPGAGQGRLLLNGASVRVGDAITFAQIDAGQLVYTPSEVSHGQITYNAAIGYRVVDDGDGSGANSLSSVAATLAIRVGQNQSATAVTLGAQDLTTIDENTDLTGGVKVADLNVTDTDGAPSRLVLSGAHAGLFEIRNEDELWLVESTTLDFETTPTLTVQVEVFGAPAINTGAINVRLNDVNEAPTATPRAGISTNDHRTYTLEAGDFGFSDVDVDDSQFHSVIITSLPAQGQGTLELNGVSVSINTPITFTDINNGRLIYTPNEVSQGQPYNAEIGYRVQDDGDGVGTNSLSSDVATLAIRVGANQSATAVSVIAQGRVTAIDENTDLTGGMKVADLDVTDTDGAPHRLTLSGANAGLFAIRNEDELWIVVDTGEILDYETTPTLTVQVGVSGAPDITPVNITVAVNNVNDNAPVIRSEGTQDPLTEGIFPNTPTDTGYRYAASDADGGTSTLRVSGDAQDRFQLDVSGKLQIKADANFDYEDTDDQAITLTITATDSGAGSGISPVAATHEVTITFENLNDNPPVITRSGTQDPLAEGRFPTNAPTNTGYRYVASDADGGIARLTLSGDNRFQLDEIGNLQIVAGSEFDRENPANRLTITALDSDEGSRSQALFDVEAVTIVFGNVNDNSPVITRSGIQQSTLNEGRYAINTDTGYRYTASDADGGTPVLSVSGDPQERFEFDANGNLQIVAGAVFDYENPADRSITLTITATDSGMGSGTLATADTETVTITFREVEVNTDSGDAVFSITSHGSQAISAETGAVLTATEVTPDPDINNATYSYQWYHIGAGPGGADNDIEGAMDRSYTVADTDEGQRIGVHVSYTEDSFQSDGTTPTGTVIVVAKLPHIADFTKLRGIVSEGEYSFNSGSPTVHFSIKETSDHLILRAFSDSSYVVYDIINPHRATITNPETDFVYTYEISGVDKDHFMFVLNGTRISIVSRTGFDYEKPTDNGQDNNYEFTFTPSESGQRFIRPTSYNLMITNDLSEAQVKPAPEPATASIIETDSNIKFTSLEDAVRGYSGMDGILNWLSATFGGAVVDTANPHRATVTFERGYPNDDIVFTYELSGDDVNDVRLVQDGNDVSLVTVAGPDYENPTDEDGMNTYNVVETITLTSTSRNIPSTHKEVSRTYTLSVTNDISKTSVEVYENHPLYRYIKIDSVALEGYQLTEGYVDNALFTINASGQVWWKAIPDYEAPHDGDGDNIYEIELYRINSNGQTHRVQVDVRVNNLGANIAPGEEYEPYISITPHHIADEHLPSDFVQHLVSWRTWKMPATGPLIITYSTDRPSSFGDIFYSVLDEVLLSYEQAANVKFVEVAPRDPDEYNDYVPYFTMKAISGIGGRVLSFPENAIDHEGVIEFGRSSLKSRDSAERLITHELGHAVGLSHPFQEMRGWPGDEDYRRSTLSVMAYDSDVIALQPADIEALQFLYGAPGTDFMGVEIFAELRGNGYPSTFTSEPQTLTEIDANTDLTAGIKVVEFYPRGQFGRTGTLEIIGDHAEFFDLRRPDAVRTIRELWLTLEEGESLENITTLEVYVRIAEKHAVRTEDITITVNDVGISGAGSSDRTSGVVGDADQIKINEAVNEGQSVIANLIDLDLGEIDLTEITIGGGDKDQVQIRPTQNGGVLEFVSAPDYEAPKDDDRDNVYEITLYDDLMSIEVDVTVIDIPEI